MHQAQSTLCQHYASTIAKTESTVRMNVVTVVVMRAAGETEEVWMCEYFRVLMRGHTEHAAINCQTSSHRVCVHIQIPNSTFCIVEGI